MRMDHPLVDEDIKAWGQLLARSPSLTQTTASEPQTPRLDEASALGQSPPRPVTPSFSLQPQRSRPPQAASTYVLGPHSQQPVRLPGALPVPCPASQSITGTATISKLPPPPPAPQEPGAIAPSEGSVLGHSSCREDPTRPPDLTVHPNFRVLRAWPRADWALHLLGLSRGNGQSPAGLQAEPQPCSSLPQG